MFSSPPLLPVSLTLCSLGFVVTLVSLDTRPPTFRPTLADWRSAIEAAASEYIPSNAVACGIVDLGSEPTDAVRCVQQAQRNGADFWVLSQGPGIDSDVWELIVAKQGSLHATMFDSYGWESRLQPSYVTSIVNCQALKFGKAVQRFGHSYRTAAVSCAG